MVAFLRRQRLNIPGLNIPGLNIPGLNLPLAPLAGGLIGLTVAILFALMPTGMLEDLVIDSGIASVVSGAEPPLGYTARFALIFLCGGAVGSVAWFALFLLLGSRSLVIQEAVGDDAERMPVLRRADAHPDAPARRPLSASRDLGMPFLNIRSAPAEDGAADDIEPDIEAGLPPASAIETRPPSNAGPPFERDLPADLNQPLAAFDPHAIPDDPAAWFPAPAPLKPMPRRQTYEPAERFETFELAPTVRKTPTPLPAARPLCQPRDTDPSASIHALLDRLEKSVGRPETVSRTPVPAPEPRTESLEDALVTLRRLATRR
jgi:hypothetical protein